MKVDLAHRVEGPAHAPLVFLSPSIGTTWELWDSLVPALSDYRVVRFDTRGHGRSPVVPGPYSVEDLARDVVGLADALGVERFGFVGLSIGGAIGQMLCTSHAERVAAAVLCCTLPKFGDPSMWHERAASVRESGMSVLEDGTRGRWFTDAFRSSDPEVVDRHLAMLLGTDPEGYAACCEALGGFDSRPRLGSVAAPVRVVAGAEDPVATPEACDEMAAAIPSADLVVVPATSHIATVAVDPFNAAVTEHLGRHL